MNTTITDQIIELASRPQGIKSSDIEGLKAADLSARCCSLVRQGRLFRGGFGRGKIVYFASIAAANEFNEAAAKAAQPVKTQPVARANWAKDAKTVVTSDTKVTICPGFKPRFEAVDLPHVMTANQSGRVVSEVA